MSKEHIYELRVRWTGNSGKGTENYRSYQRSHIISAANKPEIAASSDPSFRGDSNKYNPEELLVASLSSCHMLWFLHLCADNGVIVTDYSDKAVGIMEETGNGGGKFREVTLNPVVTVKNPESIPLINGLHRKANELCFIANSVNFRVTHNPATKTG